MPAGQKDEKQLGATQSGGRLVGREAEIVRITGVIRNVFPQSKVLPIDPDLCIALIKVQRIQHFCGNAVRSIYRKHGGVIFRGHRQEIITIHLNTVEQIRHLILFEDKADLRIGIHIIEIVQVDDIHIVFFAVIWHELIHGKKAVLVFRFRHVGSPHFFSVEGYFWIQL